MNVLDAGDWMELEDREFSGAVEWGIFRSWRIGNFQDLWRRSWRSGNSGCGEFQVL